MKKLVISIKSPKESFEKFADTMEKLKKRKKVESHFEVSFDNRKSFNRFVKNIFILEAIQSLKPNSINDLAIKIDMDQSNLNKLIVFFEQVGAIRIEEKKFKGKLLKKPIVEYDSIEFQLKKAS